MGSRCTNEAVTRPCGSRAAAATIVPRGPRVRAEVMQHSEGAAVTSRGITAQHSSPLCLFVLMQRDDGTEGGRGGGGRSIPLHHRPPLVT